MYSDLPLLVTLHLRSSRRKYKGFIPGHIHIHCLIYYIEDTSFSQDKDTTTHHFFHKTPDTTHHEAPMSMMVGCEHSLYGNDIIDIGAFDLSLNRCDLTRKRRIITTPIHDLSDCEGSLGWVCANVGIGNMSCIVHGIEMWYHVLQQSGWLTIKKHQHQTF